tara:strand:- start:45 stop:182 length:138 start_codon:yes stop_codon:yes gene_type:complete
MVQKMKCPMINIKNIHLEENHIINFEPSDEELKEIEQEIDNLIDE